MDLALPFGLRSAPYIFNSVADLVEWIIRNKYSVADLMHYLDDFITAGHNIQMNWSRYVTPGHAILYFFVPPVNGSFVTKGTLGEHKS